MKFCLTNLALILSCLCAFGQKTVQTNGNQYIFDTKTFQNVAGNGPGLSNVFGLYNSNGLYAAIGDMNSRFFVNGQANLPASSFDAFPQVFTSPNGYLSFCVFHAASSHGPTNASLMLSISSDGALTWSDPFTIITNANYDSRNFAAGMDRQGGIHVLYTTALITSSNYIWSSPHHYYSTNLGITGTDTILSTNAFDYPPSGSTQSVSFHGAIADHNGLLVCGGYNANSSGTRDFAFLSGDIGKTWTNYNMSSTAANGYGEPSIASIGTTLLLAVGRQITNGANAGTIPFYWSTNSGTNWNAPNFAPTGTTNLIGYPSGVTTFSAAGQKYVAVTYGNRQDSNVWISTIAADELYTNSTGTTVPALLTNRWVIGRMDSTSSHSESGYNSIVALQNGRLLVAYYYYTNASSSSIQFIPLSPFIDLKASRLLINSGDFQRRPLLVTTANGATNLMYIKPLDGFNTVWQLVMEDGTANSIARFSYKTGKGLVFGPESTSSSQGALINLSATNYPVFGQEGGIAIVATSTGTTRISAGSSPGNIILFYPTNILPAAPLIHVSYDNHLWPPTFATLNARSTNESWTARSNGTIPRIWYGHYDGNSNVIYDGHLP